MPSHDNSLVEREILSDAAVWLAAILLAVAVFGALAMNLPWVALGVMALVPATYCFTKYPGTAVPLVCFLLYANIPVIAVRFHGVPSIVGKLAVAPLLIPLVYYVFIRSDGIVVTRNLRWISLFVLIQFASALCSQYPILAIDAVKTSILEGLVIYLAITNTVRSKATLRQCLKGLLLAGMILGGLSVVQQTSSSFDNDFGGFAQVAAGDGFHVAQDRGTIQQRRLAGPIGEQNRYAQIMLMLVPIGTLSLFTESDVRWRTMTIVATTLSALGCALTFSRGAAVGFGMMVFVAMFMGIVKPKQFGGLCLFGLLVLVAVPQYRTRLASLAPVLGVVGIPTNDVEGPDGAMQGRATAMLAAARMWADHPILGVGPDLSQMSTRQYGLAGGLRALEGNRKAHNLYLELAAELGILGLGSFLFVVGTSIYGLKKVRRDYIQTDALMAFSSTGLMLALVSYLTTGLFLHFSYIRYFWLILALADSATHIVQAKSPPSQPSHRSLVTNQIPRHSA